MSIGSTLLSTGLGLLNSNSQKKQAKATQAANTALADKTLAQQQGQFNDVKTASTPFLNMGNNADVTGANFTHSPGYQQAIDTGTQSVLGSQALNGLLRSGSAVKALTKFTTGEANKDYNNYIDQQQGNAGIGLQGLSSISGAASGNAAALGANLGAVTGANNTAAADINSATNAGYNALGTGLGALGSNADVNSMFKAALAKLKTPTVSGGGSSYTMPAYGGSAA